MVQKLSAKLRITRRLGSLPGLTSKVSSKRHPPGQHGSRLAKKKVTQYAIRLKEKQKLRFNYGITETQLRNYVKQAKRTKKSTGTFLLQLLEMRLDTLVFRIGMASTIGAARQLVTHGHVRVNKQRVSIPSFQCKKEDLIEIQDSSKKWVRDTLERSAKRCPKHISFNAQQLEAKIVEPPHRSSIGLTLNELFVIEFYSRKI